MSKKPLDFLIVKKLILGQAQNLECLFFGDETTFNA